MGCKQCGGCCKMLGFVIPNLSAMREHQIYYKAHGCKIIGNQVIIPMRCPHLTKDNKCDIHNKKPLICKQFKGKQSGDKFIIPEECSYE